MPRIGYLLSDKKEKKFNLEKLAVRLREKDIELIKIDLNYSLEDQGPFDIIIHKITDVLSRADEGSEKDQLYANNFKNFIRNHPECTLVDPLENVCRLLNRYEQYLQVQKLELSSNGIEVFVPTFVELKSNVIEENKCKLKAANMEFPFVCKPQVAQGEILSHEMAIIFNEEGLKDVRPPCVAQSFITHNAVLYKVFVVGDEQFICERPSLKNLTAGDDKTIFFNTNDVSTPDATHFLNEMDEKELSSRHVKPNFTKLKDLGNQLRSHLKLGLFGIDVIIECGTNRYAIIDINIFPGYKGIDSFYDSFERYIIQLLKEKETDQNMERKRCQTVAEGCALSNVCKKPKIQEVAEEEFDSILCTSENDKVREKNQSKATAENGSNVDMYRETKGLSYLSGTNGSLCEQNGHCIENGNNNNNKAIFINSNNLNSLNSPLVSLNDDNNNINSSSSNSSNNNILCNTISGEGLNNLKGGNIPTVNGLT
ncbi:inositol-tetrakisphosphate 1-kinase-like [Octopus vulgaris]|uniref:Inositol-tetrakisphosphate 1-kinase n=2 Tax=Octopus vulgaris TaxID=6645 RepID=A0AA36F0Q2_OCTVU|nr:inositol-tetrakisphosphate 1-kinase-like [Octopus vulgaris]